MHSRHTSHALPSEKDLQTAGVGRNRPSTPRRLSSLGSPERLRPFRASARRPPQLLGAGLGQLPFRRADLRLRAGHILSEAESTWLRKNYHDDLEMVDEVGGKTMNTI